MIFSYNWLQSFFEKKLPKPEKLAELLTMHSFEVEGIEKKGRDFLLDIDILPDRSSDCLSYSGIASEISAVLKRNQKNFSDKAKEDKGLKTKDFIKVSVKEKKACSRYTARIMDGIKVGPSSKWLKERITSSGIQPINNIVDIANYVMLETGQPLHAFDYEKVLGGEIVVRKAKREESIISLDDKKYKLDQDILVIADKKDPLAIAGIKGGKKAEIGKETKTIILESANFNYSAIRKASRKLGLKTDASWRFENEIDPNLTEEAINRAAALIKKEAGGKIASGVVDFYPQERIPRKINLDPRYVCSLLGLEIKEKEIKDILLRLGFKIKKKSKKLEVEVPTRRLDILIEEDLVEEIGRIKGYENIPSSFPLVSLAPPSRNFSVFWENFVKDILKEAKFSEVYNYSFVSGKDIEEYPKKELVKLENPISSDCEYLRPSLIPNLLKNVKENSKNFEDIDIFELGRIFLQKRGVKEERMLTVLSTNLGFYGLKGAADAILEKLGIAGAWYDDFEATPEESKKSLWQKGRSAEVKVGSKEIGFLGKISSDILKKMKIDKEVVVLDVNFEKLQKLSSEEQEYQPISQYPSAVRDIAVLVPREVKVEEVMNIINGAGGYLIRDIDLFDIYEGEGLPEGQKNLAFHLVYQAEDRTLGNKEINKLQSKVIEALESRPEWKVRK